MPNCVNSPILQFANDVKMFQAIGGAAADFQQLQADINSFVDWSIKWQLRFNVSKCNLLHLRPLHSYGEYNINGVVISPSNLVKDLGVLIDNKFKFHNHSSVVASKANHMLTIVSKSFQYMDDNILLNLYKSFVRPIVEYGTVICGPYYVLDQQLIARIQRRAMKLIHGLHDQPYVDRLAGLHLPSLQYHCLRGDLILLYHMYHA